MNAKGLRIAMIGHKRIPSREGGIEIVVEELSVRLAKMGQRVTCYNRSGHHVSGSEYDQFVSQKESVYHGVNIKNVFTVDKRGLAAMTASLSAALRTAFGCYDLVHFHAEGPCAMLWLPKLFGKKCVVANVFNKKKLEKYKIKYGQEFETRKEIGEYCNVSQKTVNQWYKKNWIIDQ